MKLIKAQTFIIEKQQNNAKKYIKILRNIFYSELVPVLVKYYNLKKLFITGKIKE